MPFQRSVGLFRRVVQNRRRCHQCSLRHLATSALDGTSSIRNMALVAHIDSGKTTLTESILHKSSYIATPGTVDTGSTTTDFLPAERERGITIQSASIPVKWKDWHFNLIDTPGHADFGMEVESASRVVDGAVVLIDSVEGVESQTKGVWGQLDRYNVQSRLMFLNKLDRPGASFKSSLLSLLSHRLHPNPMILSLPIASFSPEDYSRAEPGIRGLIDLVKWELWKWDEENISSVHPLPRNTRELSCMDILPSNHPIIPHLVSARIALLENLSMFSEELMEVLLDLPTGSSSYLQLEASDIMPHLRKATVQNDVLPVLCGSAMKSIGTEMVMNYVGELFPSPMDVQRQVESATAPLRLLAWKVVWDKRKGWMTFVRVYSGTLKRQSSIFNASSGQKERVSKLLLLYASQAEEVEALPFGSVGVLLGLKYTRTGDTLVSTPGLAASQTSVRSIIPPPAVMSASVIPKSHSDLDPVQDALHALSRTDPSVRVDTQEGQMLVHGLGALHLEIVEGRLQDEWGVKCEFGGRRVSYREGLGNDISLAVDEWSTDVGGKSTTVIVRMEVTPLLESEQGDPVWDDNLVLGPDGKCLPSADSFRNQEDPMGNIARGIANTLSNSPHTSLALSHLKVSIKEFEYPQELPPSILAGASSSILRDRIRSAGIGPVMEPYIALKISVNEDNLGKVVKDLTENGGEVLDLASEASSTLSGEDIGSFSIDGVYVPPDELSPSSASSSAAISAIDSPRLKRTIHAVAPLSKMLDYSTRLRAISGGHGVFEMANAGFRQVAQSRKLEILREIGRA
ncbi:P-loop containing nucleoside triphosphate hydrolase protein [Hygrophoropsis aurantiaca]|uniref:P-loop containing nucleoside triphosphate hydrolase protein n=1 Tax=Hygrophoropsis aurantiaca TaxID=72124 RepID=A0ACB8AM28_9AGAM|nr:P-loop containing nucleoside triphosphate hydrolase protein [Hygrophoropsis aurantiaca]